MKAVYLLMSLVVSNEEESMETIFIESDRIRIVFGAPDSSNIKNYQNYNNFQEIEPVNTNEICESVKINFTSNEDAACFKYEDQYIPCFTVQCLKFKNEFF